MAPQSHHRRTAVRLAALVGGVALLTSATVLSPGGRAQEPSATVDAGIAVDAETGELALVRQPRQVRLDPGESLSIVCQGVLGLTPVPPSSATATCRGVLPTATTPPLSTATIPPASTATPIPPPLASATPMPTDVATPVPPASHEGVPICTDHNITQWHDVVKKNADGTINCTYTHTHMDDPRSLNSVFGTLAQTIGYPWETTGENANKHEAYKWVKYENPTCASLTNERTLRYARIQYHGDGHRGALTRFHSFWAALEWCDPNNPSFTARFVHGGWMDYGTLRVKTATSPEVYVPLPNDPPPSVFIRVHGSDDAGGFRGDYTWYGGSGSGFQLGIRNEDWGPVNPNSPNNPILFYDPVQHPGQNQSYQAPMHLVVIQTLPERTNFSGYTDRYGTVVQGCTAVSLDCIPLTIQNMPAGESQFRGEDRQAHLCCRDYDVLSPVTGKSLLKYPN